MTEAKEYNGEEKIAISIDVGTTNSAASYVYFYPGSRPEVKMVTKWPGQPAIMGDSKIPTILAYRNETLVACGAEAREFIGDDEYEIAKWFKLHLHPESMKISNEPPPYGSSSNSAPPIEIPPLPSHVTLKRLYVDFLSYMFKSTKAFFENNTLNGSRIWSRLEDRIVIILATPNGWDVTQQGFLREAAVAAGLVTQANAEGLEFITEGEAAVHYVLAFQKHDWLELSSQFIVVDAGGSTVDSTLYECKAVKPHVILREVCASECIQAGGVFVDQAALESLKAKLEGSRFAEEEFLNIMIEFFERNTKRIFDGTQESSFLQFGRNGDTDRSRGVLKGKVALTKVEVKSIFHGVIKRIVKSVIRLAGGRNVQHVLLVGGFGESPYLRTKLRAVLQSYIPEIVAVDEPSKKAAAEGASIWYIKQIVVARAARFAVGTVQGTPYQECLPDHYARRHNVWPYADGKFYVEGVFGSWVEKDTVMNNQFIKDFSFFDAYYELPSRIDDELIDVYVWEGSNPTSWISDVNGLLFPEARKICSLRADEKQLLRIVKEKKTPCGKSYWELLFWVSVRLGGTQLHARIQWDDNGKTCEGPVTIIPSSAF